MTGYPYLDGPAICLIAIFYTSQSVCFYRIIVTRSLSVPGYVDYTVIFDIFAIFSMGGILIRRLELGQSGH